MKRWLVKKNFNNCTLNPIVQEVIFDLNFTKEKERDTCMDIIALNEFYRMVGIKVNHLKEFEEHIQSVLLETEQDTINRD